jgi:energy-coupling factor transporter ATP-binding protein EcfA2
MDFFQVNTREVKGGTLEAYPDFVVGRSKDLMVRGRAFYAIWDQDAGLWSTDEYDVQRLVDYELSRYAEAKTELSKVRYMRSFGSKSWSDFKEYVRQLSDNSHQLDENLTFANTEVKKTDYVSRRLPYHLASGDISAWNELIGTLYAPEERAKIEWAIGSVISGDSKKIQKFLVLYGPAGTGKSTVLNIIAKLFSGYTTTFEAKALGSNNGSFSTEVFKNNPLVAIQHDGDLSKIEDNTKLNSIISHEEMTVNEKYKPSYTTRFNAFLWMGTNQPVKISDAKSGIIRRLIDVHPTGVKLQPNHYHALMNQIEFELGAIAHHCLEVYRNMGKNFYNTYRPLEMMLQTDIFFNFIEAHYDIFKEQNGTTLKQAYALYKEFCNDTGIERPLPQYKVREELRNYFAEFKDRDTIDGNVVRSYYSGFTAHPFKAPIKEDAKVFSLVMEESTSLLDLELAEAAAQYAKEDGTPQKRWADVKTSLAEIDTSKLHYVQVPENHIVIDFDLTDDDGQKSLERNLAAASEWPATYAELSRSGSAVHLHYHYDGEVERLDSSYAPGIEIKRFSGNSSLRRRLTRCNNVPILTINSGLPLKERKPVLDEQTIKSERGLRELIQRNLRKEIHPGTKPSIDFIHKILDEAYLSGMEYDVTDLRPKILAFANNSTNQPLQALRTVQRMRWKSAENVIAKQPEEKVTEDPLTIYDVEVYPNLFVVCWKYYGDDNVVRMINPSPQEIETLFKLKLVGFNNRRYDNHILYARYLGYDNEQLYKLSQKIIDGNVGAMFGEAYNISYTDIYDFSSKKQGLKKFQIELGIRHQELEFPWDQPVDVVDWPKVVDYCVNDVLATEAVFNARKQDFVARQILASLSGLSVNDTTQKHTARIIFGDDRNPQRDFVYTNLAKEFDGYVFDRGISRYRGETVGEGGYVYAEPGIFTQVALLDVASMHPTSIVELQLFGEYTRNFAELMEARLAIKRQDYKLAKTLLGGKLSEFLANDDDSESLAYALKIVINIVYGLTSAKFDNPFRDVRNVDNIAAKRGALFMIDLKLALQERGLTVAHIKTDSVKIPNATEADIEFVKEFGKRYGYTFEHEATYEKMALVNDAVYVAKYGWASKEKLIGTWTAVGAQFQHPYVFKQMFGKGDDEIGFDDFCETKQVTKGAIYMDFDSVKPMVNTDSPPEMQFVGRTGRFVPVKEGFGGGILYRVQDGKRYAVAGTKGYLWVEAEVARDLPLSAIDMGYFESLLEDARKTIDKFGNVDEFVA